MAPIESPVAPPAFGSYGRSTGPRLRAGLPKFRLSNGFNTWAPGIFARCRDGTCDCCPYGYHIDLDFVRFCESLKDSGNYQSYLEHLQQLKRGKREQRKALQEVMDSPEILFSSSGKKTRPPIPYSWLCERPPSTELDQPDSLNAVYQDFEETLHSSRVPLEQRLSPDGGGNDLLQCSRISEDRRHVYTKEEQQKAEQLLDMIFGDYHDLDEDDGLQPARQRTDSVSSTGSIDTISSLNYSSSNSVASRQLEMTLASLSLSGSDSRSSSRISIDRTAISKIRNQLSACLEKLRHLELQVKDVPVLQVKLSVLKEEKRLLKLQLKAKNRTDSSVEPESPSTSSLMDISPAGESHPRDETLNQLRIAPLLQITMLTPPCEPARVPPIYSEGPIPKLAPLRASTPPLSHRVRTAVDEQSSTAELLKEQLWDEAANQPRYRADTDSPEHIAVYLREASVNEPLVVPKYFHHTGINCCAETQDRATHTDLVSTRHAGVGSSSPLPPPNGGEATKKTLLCDECNETIFKPKRYPRSSATQTTFEKLKDCVNCLEGRKKRSLRTVSINTDPEEPPRKTPRETISSLGVSDNTSTLARPCEKCEKRESIRFCSVGSCTMPLKTYDPSSTPIVEPKPSMIPIKSPPPKPKNSTRNVGIQSIHVVTASQAIQVTPDRVRTRDSSCQSDLRQTQRQVGTQSDHLQTKTNSVASGDFDVRHPVCDSCSKKRLRSVGTGEIAIYDECCNRCAVNNKREGAVQCEILSENSQQKMREACEKYDKYVLTDDPYCEELTELIAIPCERCDVERRDFGQGDEDVFADKKSASKAVEHVGVMTDHSIIEPLSFASQMAGTSTGMALSRTSSASSVSHITGAVRLCDKCNCAIESVAKDFIDKNELDPVVPSLQSRIPKLKQRTVCAPPRRAKPTAFENVTKSLTLNDTVDERPIASGQETSLPEPVESIGGNGTSEGFESDFMSDGDSSSDSEDGFVSVGRIICHFPTPADAGTALLSVDPAGSLVVCRSSSGCSGSGSSVGNCESFSYTPPGLTRSRETAPEKHTLNREMESACCTLNEYLQRPENSDPNKLKAALQTIQAEWFKVTSRADIDPGQLQDYLDEIDRMSNHLLHRIVNMADSNGNTALHYAVSHGNFAVVSKLLDSKVTDVNKQNKAGYTPVMLVALADIHNDSHKITVHRLFATGDVNSKASQNGQTALMLAATHGKGEMVKMLLDADADPNTQDNDGSTALMCAAEHGYIDVVRVLLANPDVEINIADNDGQTALSIAMEAGHKDTALLIYASSNFSRGNSPYSSLRGRKSRVSPRATPPPSRPSRTPPPSRPSRTPPPNRPSRTPPPPSPSRSRKGSTSSVSSFSRAWF